MIWLGIRLGQLMQRITSRINHRWIWVYDWRTASWKETSAHTDVEDE